MSSINSTSTLAEVQAAYDDNASYAEDGDVAKCKSFITACRILIRRTPKESGSREAHMALTPDLLLKEIERAEEWQEAHDTSSSTSTGGPRVTRASFENFRR
jgi:hypothetical protein